MSSGRKPRAWADPMIDATWEWAAEVGTSRGYGVQVVLTPLRRKECWRVCVRALHLVDGRAVGVVAQVAEEWPNASYEALTSTVLRLTSGLQRALETDPLQVESAAA